MRALIVLTQPPLLEGGAPGRCAVGLLKGLQSHGVDVQALAARQYHAHDGDVPEGLPVEVLSVAPPVRGWRARTRMLARPRSHLGGGPFAERVRELSRDADILHLEETDAAWCDEGTYIPSLVHIHYLIRRDRQLPPPWSKEFLSFVEFIRAERTAARRHRWLVASSPLIADHLRSVTRTAEVVVAPLSLDPDAYGRAALEGPVAGIIGTGGWPPTAQAVQRLVTRVWPRVRQRVPTARLLIAGRGMSSLDIPSVPGVEMVGEVESGAAFVQSLSLLLYPIERGSGMKVKVLEALATGVPVVTTPQGSEGIAASDGVVVEREDEQLAAAAAAILRDAGERRERGASALETFRRHYAPGPATLPLVDLYARMAERG